jgi:hypothetical protein
LSSLGFFLPAILALGLLLLLLLLLRLLLRTRAARRRRRVAAAITAVILFPLLTLFTRFFPAVIAAAAGATRPSVVPPHLRHPRVVLRRQHHVLRARDVGRHKVDDFVNKFSGTS